MQRNEKALWQNERRAKNSCKGAALMEGRRFSANADKTELKNWADSMK